MEQLFFSTALPSASSVTSQEVVQMDRSTNSYSGHKLAKESIIPFVYIVITVVGISGNGVVLYIIKTRTASRSVTDLYVCNLAIADMLLLCTLPFWTIEMIMDQWIFGILLCKVISSLTYLTLYASIFFLTAMSLDRWFAVVKAVQSRKYRTIRNSRMVCIILWFLGLGFVVLPLLYRSTLQYGGRERCSWAFPKELLMTLNIVYSIMRSGIGFFVPLILIVFCYIDILVFLQKRKKEKKLKPITGNDKLTAMILVVISCFVICWMPNQITNFIVLLIHTHVICKNPNSQDQGYNESMDWNYTSSQTLLENTITYTSFASSISPTNGLFNENTTQLAKPVHSSVSFVCERGLVGLHLITACLGFSNSMMNPIVYSFMGTKFRMELKRLFTCASSRTSVKSSRLKNKPREGFWFNMKLRTVRSLGKKKDDHFSSIRIATRDNRRIKLAPVWKRALAHKSSNLSSECAMANQVTTGYAAKSVYKKLENCTILYYFDDALALFGNLVYFALLMILESISAQFLAIWWVILHNWRLGVVLGLFTLGTFCSLWKEWTNIISLVLHMHQEFLIPPTILYSTTIETQDCLFADEIELTSPIAGCQNISNAVGNLINANDINEGSALLNLQEGEKIKPSELMSLESHSDDNNQVLVSLSIDSGTIL